MKPFSSRIVHVATAALACVFSVTLLHAQQSGSGRVDLLTNSDFENGMQGWEFSAYHKKGTAAVDTEVKRSGNASLRIDNLAADDSHLTQTLKVKPKTRYRFSGYIKTKDVDVKGGKAATLSMGSESTTSIKGTNAWKKFDIEFETAALEVIKLGPRLGHNSSMARGTAWFDDLKLIELGPSRVR